MTSMFWGDKKFSNICAESFHNRLKDAEFVSDGVWITTQICLTPQVRTLSTIEAAQGHKRILSHSSHLTPRQVTLP